MSIGNNNIKVFIIILNWNGKDYILDCLESVSSLESTGFDINVILVDNNSTDGSMEIIQKSKVKSQNFKSKFKIIKNQANLGFTGGNNVGIRYALKNKADYVMLLNSDTIVDKNLLVSGKARSCSAGQLLEVAESDPQIGVVGPKIYFAEGHEYHKEKYQPKDLGKVIWYAGGLIDWKNILLSHRGVDEVDNEQFGKSGETDFVSGCCMLIKRNVLEKIDLLDDKYFLYLEDADFCQRAKLAGYKILYVPGAKLWHLNAGSSSVGGNLQDYFITRNRLLFGFKYANLKTKAALFREGIRLLLKGRPWQKTAVKDFFLCRFGKGKYGRTNN